MEGEDVGSEESGKAMRNGETGLRLSVSRGIVKEHRGELSLQSSEGVGACLHIDPPVGRQDVD